MQERQVSEGCIIIAECTGVQSESTWKDGRILEGHSRRFADLRPSVGDSGSSSSAKRTLVPIELLRPVRGRMDEAIWFVEAEARSSRLAKGV